VELSHYLVKMDSFYQAINVSLVHLAIQLHVHQLVVHLD